MYLPVVASNCEVIRFDWVRRETLQGTVEAVVDGVRLASALPQVDEVDRAVTSGGDKCVTVDKIEVREPAVVFVGVHLINRMEVLSLGSMRKKKKT